MGTAFFTVAKLVGIALQVETWLTLGLVLSVLGGVFARPRLASRSAVVTLAMFLLVGAFPIGDILLFPLEAEFRPQNAPTQIDGIVVLGGVEDLRATAQWGQPQLNAAAERLTAAVALAIQHPNARLVFSGGSGRLRDILSERPDIPSVAVDFFAAQGISVDRITWDDRSRNTKENARFSFELAKPASGETWVLITSGFHMGRALVSFRAAGWEEM